METLYIRADANAQIGSGHIMRTLSIAQAAKSIGIPCTFITADQDAQPLIQAYQFENICLHTDWQCLEDEISVISQLLQDVPNPYLIFDTYYVTPSYFHHLPEKWFKIYIDDFQKEAYPIDMLLNYQFTANRSHYRTLYQQKLPNLLLGEKYAPLRKEFQNLPAPNIRPFVNRICITTGNTDTYNVCGKFLESFCNENLFDHLMIDVIIGKFFKHPNLLMKKYSNNKNIVFHQSPMNISTIFQQCDIVFSAGGSTLYELCACGIPTITFIIADNQDGAYHLEQKKLLCVAGDFQKDESSCLEKMVFLFHRYANNHSLRQQLSCTMQACVDGNGAARIMKQVQNVIQYS